MENAVLAACWLAGQMHFVQVELVTRVRAKTSELG